MLAGVLYERFVLRFIAFDFVSVSTYLRVPDSEKIVYHPCTVFHLPSVNYRLMCVVQQAVGLWFVLSALTCIKLFVVFSYKP